MSFLACSADTQFQAPTGSNIATLGTIAPDGKEQTNGEGIARKPPSGLFDLRGAVASQAKDRDGQHT